MLGAAIGRRASQIAEQGSMMVPQKPRPSASLDEKAELYGHSIFAPHLDGEALAPPLRRGRHREPAQLQQQVTQSQPPSADALTLALDDAAGTESEGSNRQARDFECQ